MPRRTDAGIPEKSLKEFWQKTDAYQLKFQKDGRRYLKKFEKNP